MNFDGGDPVTAGRLAHAGVEIKLAPKTGHRTPAELSELARDCVAAIVSTDPFEPEVFEAAPALRVVARVGVGTDSVDVGAATRTGVAVTTTRGANDTTTADHTVALLLSLMRRIVENDRAIREGKWSRAGDLTPWDLRGLTVGLVGFGNIGRAVARRLSGFDVVLLASDPCGANGEPGVESVSLEALLKRSDVVSLHAPLTESTKGLIGERELAAMRSSAVLVNAARGGLVDERALVRALQLGRLRGAALDVFPSEPLGDSPLRAMPQVVLTPHIGGLSDRSIRDMLECATSQVLRVLSGQSEPGVVNPDALRHPKHEHPLLSAPAVVEAAE